jgi:hypothetical protein
MPLFNQSMQYYEQRRDLNHVFTIAADHFLTAHLTSRALAIGVTITKSHSVVAGLATIGFVCFTIAYKTDKFW